VTELRVGEIVDGRYELRRAIARGGAGTVFEAIHRITTRRVAVKLLREEAAASKEIRRRLLREARALTVARHPNVVAVLDAGVDATEAPYLVMELLEGRTLGGILMARGRLSVADTVYVGQQLCEALATVHDRGVVHRDIKPGNLFIAADDAEREMLKVFDFGIACFRDDARAPGEPKLTEHGRVVGTPEYMAPEQLQAQDEVDLRCDVYSIGVTLYECLTGSVPFEGTYGRVLIQASTQPLPPLRSRRGDVPDELAQVIERALAKRAADRFDDARALGVALLDAVDVRVGRTSLLGVRSVPPVEQSRATIPVVPEPKRVAPPESANGTPPQRRRYRRVPYITPVSITCADGSTLYGRSEDISEGGLLVVTAQRCDEAESVSVRFAVPNTGQFARVSAVARWARTGRSIGVVGFEFVDLDDAVRRSIQSFVADRTERYP
jgi:serine/threonine-protein kinase